MASPRPTPTIAVLAVPGPGDHEPGAAARRVADLLLRLRSPGQSRYTSFVERAVRIPTKPARVNPRSAPNVAPDLRRSIFAEQHPFLRTQLQYGGAAARDREEDSPDHQLMRAQLAAYRSTGEPYETARLEGERVTESPDGAVGEVQARLHVYEVRWSDLTRLGPGIRRVAGELYQMFFHLTHLGRTALDHARLEHAGSGVWRWYGTAHTWAVRLLTLFVPAVLVAMLTTLASAALPRLVGGELLAARIAVIGWLAVAAGGAYLIFAAYERLRPGALAVGGGTFVATAAPLAVVVARARGDDELLEGTIGVFELEALFAAGLWTAIQLAGALAGALGVAAVVRTRGAARSRAWRAARTAAGTLAFGVASSLTATFVLCAATLRAIDGWLPTETYVALLPVFRGHGQEYAAFFERVLEAVAGAGVPLLVPLAGVLAVIAAAALLPVLVTEIRPPRASEAFEQHPTDTAPLRRDAPVDTDGRWTAWERLRLEGDRSQRHARRTARALRVVGAALALLYIAVFVVTPATSITSWLTGAGALAALEAAGTAIILAAGAPLVAAALLLVGCRGPLARLTVGFRAPVDVVLEVDNYLRTHPRAATPRARVAERFASVLRHVCQWRDEGGRPYDAIVVVANSQGAAITADMLTFVQREEDPELEPIRRPHANGAPDGAGRRLFLLTTGSPLRQLYSEWFPHLFAWVRGETGDGVARPLPTVPREPWMLLPRLEDGHRVAAPAIPADAAPDPYTMGVTRWVNAYRSGDYVGRAQWRHAADGCEWIDRPAPPDAVKRFISDAPPVTYVSEDAHRSRRELCIGGGAHTHYWDATAKGIAVELDLLIVDATRMAARVAKDSEAPAEGMES